MNKTKKWALWGAGIGLVIGLIETVGIVYCNWNPVEGSVVAETYFCHNLGIIYLLGIIPDIFFKMLPDIVGINTALETYNDFVYPVMMILSFIFFGSILSILLSKIIKQK